MPENSAISFENGKIELMDIELLLKSTAIPP